MTLLCSEPKRRFTRRSFLLATSSSAALLAMSGHSLVTVAKAAQEPISTGGAFFDPTVVHDITATFDVADYDAVIAAYKEAGEKEWLQATLTIDGETFEDAGLRLKGNSSLMGIRELGSPGDDVPAMAQTIPSADADTAAPSQVDPDALQDEIRGGNLVGGPSNVSADEPEGLPWLVRLDKFVDGQNVDGVSEFVIRSNNSDTALNEALALDLLAAAGLASQAAAYVRFSANGSEPRLRITIENPNDAWLAAHFDPAGTLFKSEAEGNWDYRGEDWEAYVVSFDLEAGGGDDDGQNYAPLISFLDFVNNSDDTAFVSELSSRIDVEQFAVYLAMMDLIQNGDDIDGPGNNSYLYVDDASETVTVVPWDMNLAFGGIGMGGGAFAPGDAPAFEPGQGPMMLIDGTPVSGDELPTFIQGGQPVDGTPTADDQQAGPGTGDVRRGPGPGNGPGFGSIGNPLVSRWTENADFATLQRDTMNRLREELFSSGVAAGILARWGTVLETHATDLVDRATIENESQRLLEQIDVA